MRPGLSKTFRATRRLRREGRVPGVLYGLGEEPLCFSVDARELRHALHAAGAVLELSGDGEKATAAVLKDSQRHPASPARRAASSSGYVASAALAGRRDRPWPAAELAVAGPPAEP